MADIIVEEKEVAQEQPKETKVTQIKINGEDVSVDERVFKHFQAKTKAEIERNLQPILQKVEALEREKEEVVKSSMTEAQLRKYTEQKELEELKKTKEELEAYRTQARNEKIENSLHQELDKYNDIFNKRQVINQIKSEYSLDIVSNDGFNMVVAKKDGQALPLSDAIELLRKDESNKNLWIDTLKSGNNTTKTGKDNSNKSIKAIMDMPDDDFLKSFTKGEFDNIKQ